jgi:hypothetical protein
MTRYATIFKRLFAACLLIPFLAAGAVQAQVINPPGNPSDLADLPLTFNMDTDQINWEGYTFFPFEGATLERIANPHKTGLNVTDHVLQYVKAAGQPWAGFFYHTDEEITITDDTVFRLNAFSNVAGIRAMLKLEMRQFPDVNTGDLFTDVTVSGEWAQLEWDLSGIDRETPWDRVVIIFDLQGPAGTGGDRFTWYLDDFSFEATATNIGDEEAGIPGSMILNQNYPNPFNPATDITFTVVRNTHVTLEVFDILGQRVATLVDRPMAAGYHETSFNAANLPSGVYIYRLQAGGEVQSRRMTLVK